MTTESRKLIRSAFQSSFGDDLERAEHTFRSYSDEKLRQPYGMSEKTPLEILNEYRADRQRRTVALAEFDALP